MIFRTDDQVDIPENSGHSQLILVFQIGTVTPFQYQNRQKVFPFPDVRGDVKFADCVGNLAVSDKVPIHPYIKAGIHTFKIQVYLFPVFFSVHGKDLSICSTGIFRRYIGRIIGNRITDICIQMTVHAIILPACRNGYYLKIISVFLTDEILRNFIGGCIKGKLPFSIQ